MVQLLYRTTTIGFPLMLKRLLSYTQQNIWILIGLQRMHKKVIECKSPYRVLYGNCHGNDKEAPILKTKMADSRFAEVNENIVEELKENAKNTNTKRATQTWVNVWQEWAHKRHFNPKLEDYVPEILDKEKKFCWVYDKQKIA